MQYSGISAGCGQHFDSRFGYSNGLLFERLGQVQVSLSYYGISATHCNTLQHTATRCNTHTNLSYHWIGATHCIAPQHTATYCNTLQHTANFSCIPSDKRNTHVLQHKLQRKAHVLQHKHTHTAIYCNTHSYYWIRECNTHMHTLPHAATHCNTLQHTAIHLKTRSTTGYV